VVSLGADARQGPWGSWHATARYEIVIHPYCELRRSEIDRRRSRRGADVSSDRDVAGDRSGPQGRPRPDVDLERAKRWARRPAPDGPRRPDVSLSGVPPRSRRGVSRTTSSPTNRPTVTARRTASWRTAFHASGTTSTWVERWAERLASAAAQYEPSARGSDRARRDTCRPTRQPTGRSTRGGLRRHRIRRAPKAI
jgi:hypothetical protein